MVWHTVFDFFGANMLIHAGDNVETMTAEIQRTTYIGAGMVLIAVIPIFFFQFYILESGVFGLALLILYWKTRNIWACGLAHGLFDFFAGYTEGLFVPTGDSGSSYINTGEDGARILITYFIIAAINAVLTFIVWKKVGKTIDFEKIRREW